MIEVCIDVVDLFVDIREIYSLGFDSPGYQNPIYRARGEYWPRSTLFLDEEHKLLKHWRNKQVLDKDKQKVTTLMSS